MPATSSKFAMAVVAIIIVTIAATAFGTGIGTAIGAMAAIMATTAITEATAITADVTAATKGVVAFPTFAHRSMEPRLGGVLCFPVQPLGEYTISWERRGRTVYLS